MGRHRAAEFLPQAGGSQSDGDSFAAALHHTGETQPPSSTVSLDLAI